MTKEEFLTKCLLYEIPVKLFDEPIIFLREKGLNNEYKVAPMYNYIHIDKDPNKTIYEIAGMPRYEPCRGLNAVFNAIKSHFFAWKEIEDG